jgi:hypothetical protein
VAPSLEEWSELTIIFVHFEPVLVIDLTLKHPVNSHLTRSLLQIGDIRANGKLPRYLN